MKKLFFLLASVLLLNPGMMFSNTITEPDKADKDNTLRIVCSPDLYPLAVQWTNDYCALNPGLHNEVVLAGPESLNETMGSGHHLALISKKYYVTVQQPSAWNMVVGRDVIVPVINAGNPLAEKINQSGVTLDGLAGILDNKELEGWGYLSATGDHVPLNYYVVSNADESDYVVFADITGNEVNDGNALITAIQNDQYGLGFCKLSELIKMADNGMVDNIAILPVDKNGNGQMDHFEQIYTNLNEFSRGVWIGKYPRAFINDLYFVSEGIPENETERAFVKWTLTDGQQAIENAGFSGLLSGERLAKLDQLTEPKIFTEPIEESYAIQNIFFIILVILVAGGLIFSLVARRRRNAVTVVNDSPAVRPGVINENSVSVPKGIYYDKTHTWVFMEKDGTVKVGVDDFLQHVTGPFTRIKMKKPTEMITRNQELFSLVQNGKHLNIYSPVTGKIKVVNESLDKNPSLVNTSPYSEGWVYTIEPTNWIREIQFLKMASAYREWLKKEFVRLKDFLVATLNPKSVEYAQVIMQDGGELHDNVLQPLGPEVWEDFQKNFINNAELA